MLFLKSWHFPFISFHPPQWLLDPHLPHLRGPWWVQHPTHNSEGHSPLVVYLSNCKLSKGLTLNHLPLLVQVFTNVFSSSLHNRFPLDEWIGESLPVKSQGKKHYHHTDPGLGLAISTCQRFRGAANCTSHATRAIPHLPVSQVF